MYSEIHLALRFDAEWWPNPSLKVNTVQTHRDVINQHRDVWWGKFGRGISHSKFIHIKNQIDQGIPTYAYLFENSPFEGAFVAQINGIANDYFDTKPDLIPAYYRRESKSYELFLKFNLFTSASRNDLIDNLILLSNPIKGSLESAFRGASSLFYVNNLSINQFDEQKETIHD
jgi:hypothetical protein